jgi:hypothetical protein
MLLIINHINTNDEKSAEFSKDDFWLFFKFENINNEIHTLYINENISIAILYFIIFYFSMILDL